MEIIIMSQLNTKVLRMNSFLTHVDVSNQGVLIWGQESLPVTGYPCQKQTFLTSVLVEVIPKTNSDTDSTIPELGQYIKVQPYAPY